MLNDIRSRECMRDETLILGSSLILGVLLTITDCEEIGSLVFKSTIEVFGFFELGCLPVNDARGFQVV